MTGQPIYIVDAFTGNLGEKALRGNPAAVVVLNGPAEDDRMQAVAAEMNLSETAFVYPENEETFRLRWFTPTAEVDLCGHATLATAHVLWESGVLPYGKVARFDTRSGLLTARKQEHWIELDFPAQPVRITTPPPGLAAALGIEVRFPVSYWKAEDDWLLEVPAGIVETLQPDFLTLKRFSQHLKCRGFIVTAASSTSEYDFVSRFFGPAVGVNEDPVTGSAHTKLAPFWGKQLRKTELIGYQASKRGGIVRVDWRESRVVLSGQASTFLSGVLR